MQVIVLRYSTDYGFYPNCGTRVYENTEKGYEKAISYLENQLPKDERDLSISPGASVTFSTETLKSFKDWFTKQGWICDSYAVDQKFALNFSFTLSRHEVE